MNPRLAFAVCLFAAALLPQAGHGLPRQEAARASQCLDPPQRLEELTSLRIEQGLPAEAEALANCLVGIRPDSDDGWGLLAVTRYLQDDPLGALRAWSRGRPPVVRHVAIAIHGHDGPRAPGSGSSPARVSGIALGQPLTLESLVLGERRLEALPATARARLKYRADSMSEASIEGTVVLGANNPFTGPDLVPHGVRALAGRVHVESADPLGRLERWELDGKIEGSLRRAAFGLSHPGPNGSGVWRWRVDYEVGRYESALTEQVVREERTGLEWSHTDWVSASLRAAIHTRIDFRPGRGTFAGAGVGWTVLALNARSSVRAEGMGWARVRAPSKAGNAGNSTRFGRLELLGSLYPTLPEDGGAPSGLGARGGLMAVSAGTPADLTPRMGAGGNAAALMRGRSDLDSRGVVRPLFPGRAWVHGGVELLYPVRVLGPIGVGLALFADGVRVLTAPRRSGYPTAGGARTGAIHLGAGVRTRIPGVDGWLRADWGIDPTRGGSQFSAAWVYAGPRAP